MGRQAAADGAHCKPTAIYMYTIVWDNYVFTLMIWAETVTLHTDTACLQKGLCQPTTLHAVVTACNTITLIMAAF